MTPAGPAAEEGALLPGSMMSGSSFQECTLHPGTRRIAVPQVQKPAIRRKTKRLDLRLQGHLHHSILGDSIILDRPQPQGAVLTSRGEPTAIGTKGDAVDRIFRAGQFRQEF